MLSLRTLARSAPRSAARFSTKAVRPQSLRPAAAFQPWAAPIPRLTAAFHMSAVRRQDDGASEELVAKLQSEISMEEGMKEDEDLSANIKDYLENSPFEACNHILKYQ